MRPRLGAVGADAPDDAVVAGGLVPGGRRGFGRVADDDVGRDRAFDGVERAADLVAALAERVADRLDAFGRAEAVPDVGVAGGRPQGLGRAGAADEDREARLDGAGE